MSQNISQLNNQRFFGQGGSWKKNLYFCDFSLFCFGLFFFIPLRFANRRLSRKQLTNRSMRNAHSWCKEFSRRFSRRTGRKATSPQTDCVGTQAKVYFYKCAAAFAIHGLYFFLTEVFQKLPLLVPWVNSCALTLGAFSPRCCSPASHLEMTSLISVPRLRTNLDTKSPCSSWAPRISRYSAQTQPGGVSRRGEGFRESRLESGRCLMVNERRPRRAQHAGHARPNPSARSLPRRITPWLTSVGLSSAADARVSQVGFH